MFTNALQTAFTVVGEIFSSFFSYGAVLCGSTALVVLAVAVYGLTPMTLVACIVTPVAAGLYNFYFNSGFRQI